MPVVGSDFIKHRNLYICIEHNCAKTFQFFTWKIICVILQYSIPFAGTRGGGLSSTSDETDDVMDVIDLQKPLSSPSVIVPPSWF